MGKKHRDRRQKYVELLRKNEKEREAYLEKRNRKRTRDDDADEESHQQANNRPDENTAELKKRRVDPAGVAPASADPSSTVRPPTETSVDNADEKSLKKKSQSKKKY